MTYSKPDLHAALQAVFPETYADHLASRGMTLPRLCEMAASDLFCGFISDGQVADDQVEIIKSALRDLRLKGTFNFEQL